VGEIDKKMYRQTEKRERKNYLIDCEIDNEIETEKLTRQRSKETA